MSIPKYNFESKKNHRLKNSIEFFVSLLFYIILKNDEKLFLGFT